MTDQDNNSRENKLLFWGCFIALIATAFGFVCRMFLLSTWEKEFGLDAQQAGALAGIGIWPFAVGIILFSLVIDKIGYKKAMYFAFFSHVTYAVMAMIAGGVENKQAGYQLLYWGSFILALGNGTVEAFINPVVATMFKKDKVKWLNILHAGWPGGLVVTGMIFIALGNIHWSWKVGLIVIPAVVYGAILMRCTFPVSERVAGGVSYREMLQEFGILGAIIVSALIVREVGNFFALKNAAQFVIAIFLVAGFGAYVRTLGRPILFFLMLIMIPLATTEIGTDGWITGIMEPIMVKIGLHPGWVLIYTSAIMLVLRFYAGPIVHKFSPLGLLIISSVLAIAGLTYLSVATGISILIAATLYGFGKTFFWPTMLGVVSEQCPKGGALTLNAIGGVGMLAVGVLGFPFIGKLQVDYENKALLSAPAIIEKAPGLVADGQLTVIEEKTSIFGKYSAINEDKLSAVVPESEPEVAQAIGEVRAGSKKKALKAMAVFPTIMLGAYILLALYFRAKGGYKPIQISHEKETGGIQAPAEF